VDRHLFSRDTATAGQTVAFRHQCRVGSRGFNALSARLSGDAALPVLFLDTTAQRVERIVGLTLKIGNVPSKLAPLLRT